MALTSLVSYYSVGQKNLKWQQKIVWHLHDHAINNACIIYKANNTCEKNLTNLQFRLKLTQGHRFIWESSDVMTSKAGGHLYIGKLNFACALVTTSIR